MNAGAELVGQRAGAIHGAVGQMHTLDAALDQSEHHRARRPAGAQHQRFRGCVPARRAGVEIVDEAFDVGVGRAQFAASYHSVLAAPTARARASGADSASARSLCGMVTLAPTKPWVRDAARIRQNLPAAPPRYCSRPRCQACAASNDGSAASANAPPAIRSDMRRGVLSRLSSPGCTSRQRPRSNQRLSILSMLRARRRQDRAQCQRGGCGKPDRRQVDPVIGERAENRAHYQRRPQQQIRHPGPARRRRAAPPRAVARP